MAKYLLLFALSYTILIANSTVEYNKHRYTPALNQLSTKPSISYYRDEHNRTVGVDGRIVVQCSILEVCKNSLLQAGITSTKPLGRTMLVIEVDESRSVFVWAEVIEGLEGVKMARPNFIKPIERR